MDNLIEKRTKALQNSVKYMRAFLDLQPSPVCIVDKKNNDIIDASQKFFHIFGFISPKELQDLFQFPQVVKNSTPEEYLQLLTEEDWIQLLIVNRDKVFRVTIEIDGEKRNYEISAHNMLYSSGVSDEEYQKNNYVVVILYDITSLMAEMEKNRKQEEKLIQNSKMAQMGEMIGSIAHQWKQPLSILSLYSEDIPEHYKDKEELERISTEVLKQIDYMSETINDFRKFFIPAKNEQIFDVYDSVVSVEKLIGKHLKKDNVRVEISGTSAFVIGFENEFKQIVINIANNAKDAIVERGVKKGFVKILVTSKDNQVTIEIKDNGGGVPQDILPDKIFLPYITTKGDNGTGIGLSMVKTLIENKFGGNISVTNEDDGACFLITLPEFKSHHE